MERGVLDFFLRAGFLGIVGGRVYNLVTIEITAVLGSKERFLASLGHSSN